MESNIDVLSGSQTRGRYFIALVVSGLCWFVVAGLLGTAIPILNEAWVQHLLSAVITSLAVGYIFKKWLIAWRGWRWYILPLLTIFVASALYGFLVPLSWWVSEMRKGHPAIDSDAFFLTPMMVLYSMTVYLPVLYPLALITQTLLRKVYRTPAL